MFSSWGDAATSCVLVMVANLAVNLVIGARDGMLVIDTLAAKRGLRRGQVPEHTNDLWMSIVGQRLADGRRRRGTLAVVLAVVVLDQALGFDGYLAAGLTFGVWLLVEAGTRVALRIGYGVADDKIKTTRGMSVWQEIKVLADYGLQPTNTNPLSGRWRPLGLVVGVVSVGLALVGWIALFAAVGGPVVGVGNPVGDLLRAGGPVLQGVGGAAAVLMARIPLDVAARFALARPRSARAYDIVFLRSFQDDHLAIRARGESRGVVDRLTLRYRHGYERLLVASLQFFGPVVAIGQPGERLPPTGAFRQYYENDEWQHAVTGMLRAAKFIVLSLGETPSVGWEISRLKDLDVIDRTLFLVPPVDREHRRTRLQLLAANLGVDSSLITAPENGVEYVGVMFREGRPVPLASAGHDYASYYSAILEAGFPLFEGANVVSTDAADMAEGAFARSTVTALTLASARRDGWPMNTFHMLCALVDTDIAGPWQMALTRIAAVKTDDYQLHLDRPADIAGEWAGVPLSSHAVTALRRAVEMSGEHSLALAPPEALLAALLEDPTSAASRALVAVSGRPHTEVAELAHGELSAVGRQGA